MSGVGKALVLARADLRAAAAALGGDVNGTSILCPGPGHSPADRSLSVRFEDGAPDGFLVNSFAGDDPLVCRDHVRALLGLGPWRPGARDLPPVPRRPKPAADDEPARIAAALRLWGEAREPRGTPVESYLNGRGLHLGADVAGEVLRYHPALLHPEGRAWPAMVGLMRDLRDDKPCGIHRTFLARDGSGKAPVEKPRLILGRSRHAAIKLDADENVELGLVVAEGIESGLAGRALGFRPCWALGSAVAIAKLPVLPGIEGLTVVGENDANGANMRAARECAARWTAAGIDVEVLEPTALGDANDVLRRRG